MVRFCDPQISHRDINLLPRRRPRSSRSSVTSLFYIGGDLEFLPAGDLEFLPVANIYLLPIGDLDLLPRRRPPSDLISAWLLCIIFLAELMEYPGNQGSYLSLSRKELQELCKKNNLPANKSTTQLAKSLASFFKKKIISSSSIKVSSTVRKDAAAYNTCLPNTDPEEVTTLSEGETVRGIYEKFIISSESDTHKVPPVIEENASGDMQDCQTQDQWINNDFVDHQILDAACDACVIDTYACKFNYESTNVLDWSFRTDVLNRSLHQHGDMHVKSSVDVDVQHATTVGSQLDHWCNPDRLKNESQNSQNRWSYGQGLLVNRTGDSEAHLLPSRGPRLCESSIEVGYASSYESYSKAAPSFDFFMMSDDGINLYVDLNSSSSEWIQKLKDEVCINQKVEHQSLGSLTNLTRGFFEADVQLKSLQSKCTVLNLQKVGKTSGFTNFSSGSIFNGNCQAVYPTDATLASSVSSIITSSSNPVDICNHVVSSCIANNDFHNLTATDNTSIHHEENILPQDSLDNAFRMERRNNGREGAEISIACNTTPNICEKSNIQNSDDILNNVKDSGVGATETYMSVNHISLEMKSRCEKSSGSCQFGVQSNLNSEAHPCQHWSNRLGDSLPKDSNSSAGESSRKNCAILAIERLQCSDFQNSMDNNSKRSCNPEYDEVTFNIERHHSDRINKKRYLGCTMSSTKGSVGDVSIPPRRSSRNHSKF